MGEVPVTEGGEFIQHDAEHRPVAAAPLLLALITLANYELQVLEQHLPQGAHRLSVLVHVQRHKEDQFLFDHLIDREQVFVRSGDHRQLIIQKGHALVQESLDLGYALTVLERLI